MLLLLRSHGSSGSSHSFKRWSLLWCCSLSFVCKLLWGGEKTQGVIFVCCLSMCTYFHIYRIIVKPSTLWNIRTEVLPASPWINSVEAMSSMSQLVWVWLNFSIFPVFGVWPHWIRGGSWQRACLISFLINFCNDSLWDALKSLSLLPLWVNIYTTTM